MSHLYTQDELDDARFNAWIKGILLGAVIGSLIGFFASLPRNSEEPDSAPRVHLRAPAPELRPDASHGAPVRRARALGEVWREGGADYVRM